MTFELALPLLRLGSRLRRAHSSWPFNQYIEIQLPDASSKMTLPYFYRNTAGNNLIPWEPTGQDILATDWCVVHPIPKK